jgi:hypothetical protein
MQQGDKYIKKKTVVGKIRIAFIDSKNPEDEYLIRMRGSDGGFFFVHKDVLKTKWHDAKKGIQTKIF